MDISQKQFKIENRQFFFFFIFMALLIRGYVLILPFDSHNKTIAPGFLFVIRDFIWMFFLFLSVGIFIVKRKNLSMQYFFKVAPFILFYISYLLLSSLHFFHRDFSSIIQNDWRNFVFYTLSTIIIIPIYIKSISDFEWLFDKILLISILILAIGILFQYGLGSSIWDKRLLATMENPNTYGSFLVFILLLSLHKLILGEKKILMLFLVGLNGLGLILTGSFQNIISFIIGFALLLLSYIIYIPIKKRKLMNFLLVFLFMFVVCSLFFFLMSHKLDALFVNLVNRFNAIFIHKTGSSLTHRLVQAQYVIKNLQQSSFFSFVFGNFNLNRYMKFDNQFYNVFINNGFLPFATFVFVFFVFFLKIALSFFYSHKKSTYKKKLLEGYALPVFIYTIVFFVVTNNFTAMFNRFPLNILIGVCIGYLTFFLYHKGDMNASITY